MKPFTTKHHPLTLITQSGPSLSPHFRYTVYDLHSIASLMFRMDCAPLEHEKPCEVSCCMPIVVQMQAS
jgi:hypothetical protein